MFGDKVEGESLHRLRVALIGVGEDEVVGDLLRDLVADRRARDRPAEGLAHHEAEANEETVDQIVHEVAEQHTGTHADGAANVGQQGIGTLHILGGCGGRRCFARKQDRHDEVDDVRREETEKARRTHHAVCCASFRTLWLDEVRRLVEHEVEERLRGERRTLLTITTDMAFGCWSRILLKIGARKTTPVIVTKFTRIAAPMAAPHGL